MSDADVIVADVLREFTQANTCRGDNPAVALRRAINRLSQLMFGDDMDQEPKRQALDAYVDLLDDDRECQRMIKFWEDRRDKIKEQLSKVMGDAEIGTVDGEPVFFYEPKDQFRGGDFKKQFPDLARMYTRPVTVVKFDEAAFRHDRPDMWAEFRVRAMRNAFSAPRTVDG